ncbi:MAG: hypothetical protein L3J50_12400, partial [Emcibacter sp.]|nr:hypothetical protein [Emcibacter sp.]
MTAYKQFILFLLCALWPYTVFGEATVQTVAAVQDMIEPPEINLTPLSNNDVKLYKRIFALQVKGKWKKADRLIRQLDDKILLGHILYQRYMHPTAYRSRYSELSKWMLAYPDLPGAKRIYALAKKKNGGRSRKLHKPIPALAFNFPADKPIRTKAKKNTVTLSADTIDPTVAMPRARLKK